MKDRFDLAYYNSLAAGTLTGHLGIVFTHMQEGEIVAEMEAASHLLAPNGFLHAGSLVTLADYTAGLGCISHLPEGAMGFTTLELKTNHLSTTRSGMVTCVAKPAHRGRTTQVWDAVITQQETGKTMVLFRCTQMMLYPK